MRLLSLLVLVAATFTNAQVQNFCQYYTKAVFKDQSLTHQYDLITAVVGRTILGCNSVDPTKSASGLACDGLGSNATTIVVGLLDAASGNLGFFDGTGAMNGSAAALTGSQAKNAAKVPPVAVGANGATVFATINATTKQSNSNPSADFLINHLVEWFGRDLQCDLNTTAPLDASSESTGIARYNGIGDMTAVHKDMVITKPVWQGFVNALVGALKSFGVAETSTDATVPTIANTIVPYAQGFLRATSGTKIICNQADCDLAPTAAPGSTTAPPTTTPVPGSTTAPPTTPPTKNNNTATAIAASPVIIMGAVALTMLL